MYWSIYDTLLLVTGVITAAIALIPIETIPPRTRVTAGLVGAGVILLALILGNMRSFTYPGIVFVAPVLPLLSAGVIIKTALARRALDASSPPAGADASPHHQYDEAAHAQATAPPSVIAPSPVPDPPAAPPSARERAWVDLHDPRTNAERLAAIAEAHPEFAGVIGAHPQAYPELRAWAAATRHREIS